MDYIKNNSLRQVVQQVPVMNITRKYPQYEYSGQFENYEGI